MTELWSKCLDTFAELEFQANSIDVECWSSEHVSCFPQSTYLHNSTQLCFTSAWLYFVPRAREFRRTRPFHHLTIWLFRFPHPPFSTWLWRWSIFLVVASHFWNQIEIQLKIRPKINPNCLLCITLLSICVPLSIVTKLHICYLPIRNSVISVCKQAKKFRP